MKKKYDLRGGGPLGQGLVPQKPVSVTANVPENWPLHVEVPNLNDSACQKIIDCIEIQDTKEATLKPLLTKFDQEVETSEPTFVQRIYKQIKTVLVNIHNNYRDRDVAQLNQMLITVANCSKRRGITLQ